MDDLISRQAAIDGADAIIARDTSGNNDVVKAMTAWKSYVEALPSVQTEVEKDTNIPINDCISRKAAIDAIEHITSSMSVCVNTDECHGMKRMQRQAVIELANLPSAQPERCSDCIANGGDWECDHIHCRKGQLPFTQPEILACGEGELNVPDTNVEDIISRRMAIDAVLKISEDETAVHNGWVDPYYVMEMLKRLPSAQPENQNGEWKECGTITIEGYRACLKECSKCHSTIVGFGNFCPVCGADMRTSE